jgi:predicted ATPase
LGLHPYAIKLLASLLYEAADSCQVIVSTQASLLLDELSPEQVIVVNQHDGASTFERLDPERLGEWLEEYTLGQLWEKNELGGLP